MKTITVLNLKGGIGKTTTARNIGYILAETYQKRVLMCDVDSSGNLSSSYVAREDLGDLCPIAELMLDTTKKNDRKHIRPQDKLVHIDEYTDLLSSNNTLKAAEQLISVDQSHIQQFRLMNVLKELQDDYDYCIIDCPSDEGLLVINALACSNDIIIPTMVNQDAIDAVIRVVNLANEVSDFNPGLSIAGVLFTDVQNNLVDREGICIDFGPDAPVFHTYIRHCVDVERSRFQNMALREFVRKVKHRSFTAANDYDNLVAEYLGEPLPHADFDYPRDEVIYDEDENGAADE